MSFQVGQRVWARDRGGESVRGGLVIQVNHEDRRLVCVEATGTRKGKTVVDTVVLTFEEIDPDMVEETQLLDRGKIVRSILRRMGERTSATRTPEDERDIDAIDQLWTP